MDHCRSSCLENNNNYLYKKGLICVCEWKGKPQILGTVLEFRNCTQGHHMNEVISPKFVVYQGWGVRTKPMYVKNNFNPPVSPFHLWVWPSLPWQRIHFDFAGPFTGQLFVIVVDAHSKWPQIIPKASTATTKTIEVLWLLFASYGVPNQLASDSCPKGLYWVNTVKHICAAHFRWHALGWGKGRLQI